MTRFALALLGTTWRRRTPAAVQRMPQCQSQRRSCCYLWLSSVQFSSHGDTSGSTNCRLICTSRRLATPTGTLLPNCQRSHTRQNRAGQREGGYLLPPPKQRFGRFQQSSTIGPILRVGMLHQEFHVANQVRQTKLDENVKVTTAEVPHGAANDRA